MTKPMPATAEEWMARVNQRLGLLERRAGTPDSGWQDITVNPGFQGHSTDTPKVRRIGSVLLFRGGWNPTGMVTSGSFTVGQLPAGFFPVNLIISQPGITVTAGNAVVRFETNGNVIIQTGGGTLSSYYWIAGISGTID